MRTAWRYAKACQILYNNMEHLKKTCKSTLKCIDYSIQQFLLIVPTQMQSTFLSESNNFLSFLCNLNGLQHKALPFALAHGEDEVGKEEVILSSLSSCQLQHY